MAPRKKTPSAAVTREQQLEQQLHEMRGQLQMLTQVALKPQAPVVAGKPMVGIRNISSYSVGLVNKIPGEEGEIQLAPERPETYEPSARAVVSQQFWQALKKGREVQLGVIMRDDTFLSGELVAPEDRPEEIPADFQKNAVVDPFQWIESKTEAELRDAIKAMTSEPSLRRLFSTVDYMVWKIGEDEFKDDEQRAKKAYDALPMKYRYVENLVLDRLDEFRPNHKNYANETKTIARF
jgi:hypothetical protein